ncbi:MAG: Ig-like domain-containing protein [Christensenellales bacterium]
MKAKKATIAMIFCTFIFIFSLAGARADSQPRWPVSVYDHDRITSSYGWRPDPFGSGVQKWHNGIDIESITLDKNILASLRGTVIKAVNSNSKIGFGTHMVIRSTGDEFGSNIYEITYAHMVYGSLKYSEGEPVKQGAVIGTMGETGNVTGVHLHFEVSLNGKAIDPEAFMGTEFFIWKNPMDISGIYKTISADVPLRSIPSSGEAYVREKVPLGTELYAVQKGVNYADHIWYKVEYKGFTYYVYGPNVKYVREEFRYTLTNLTIPPEVLTIGQKWDISGNIAATHNITSLAVSILRKPIVTIPSAFVQGSSVQPNEKKASISEKINLEILFGILPAGDYRYIIWLKSEAGGFDSLIHGSDFSVVPALLPVTVTAVTVSESSITLGGALDWSIATNGGSGQVAYRFQIYKDGAVEYDSDFTASNVMTYTPKAAGNYTATGYAKDSLGESSLGGPSVSVVQPAVLVSDIQLSPQVLEMETGEIKVLTATPSPDNATNQGITWSSSIPGVAEVSQDGTVTAISPGEAVISATAADGGGASTDCIVLVKDPAIPVSSMTLNEDWINLLPGGVAQLVPAFEPQGSLADIVWSSDDTAVAMVDASGHVTAVAEGMTAVHAIATGLGDVSAYCVVAVYQAVDAPVATLVSNEVQGVSFTWTAVEDAVSFDIHRAMNGSAMTYYMSTSQASFVDTDVTPSCSYDYAVSAWKRGNGVGSPKSNVLSVTIPDLVTATPPPMLPGDADLSSEVDLQDLVALIDYLVAGKAPASMENANADGLGEIDIQDLVWIIDKIVGG